MSAGFGDVGNLLPGPGGTKSLCWVGESARRVVSEEHRLERLLCSAHRLQHYQRQQQEKRGEEPGLCPQWVWEPV